ncbi:MAG: DUF4276 family protein [Candidatus Lokiarchaeota archaeon]|nr:DUF4276 family protein [Candidatus Lokiarchaeota archaeon]
MNKIGVIVDGEGDFASVNNKYKSKVKVLKTDGPRGHCADINQIVSRSKKQVNILKNYQCPKIIILIDYECGRSSYKKFINSLKEYFKNVYGDTVIACSPNIMIENWYLADVEIISKTKVYIKNNLKQKNYEGQNGKDCIKKLFNNKYSYSEKKHGPELFRIIRDDVALKNSNSYKDFLKEMADTRIV